jgi:hypothetical protein
MRQTSGAGNIVMVGILLPAPLCEDYSAAGETFSSVQPTGI